MMHREGEKELCFGKFYFFGLAYYYYLFFSSFTFLFRFFFFLVCFFCWNGHMLIRRSCSLPLTVRDFSWPSSSTSTRSWPFSTMLHTHRHTLMNILHTYVYIRLGQCTVWGVQYRLVVILLPLMNLVEVETERKFPIPPPPPPPPPPKDVEEKEVKFPPPIGPPSDAKPEQRITHHFNGRFIRFFSTSTMGWRKWLKMKTKTFLR